MVASSRVLSMLRIGSVRSVAATILRAEMSASSAAQRSHPDELSLRATRPHVDAPAAGMQSKRRCLVHLNTAFASSLAFGCGAYPHGREAGESRWCSIGGIAARGVFRAACSSLNVGLRAG